MDNKCYAIFSKLHNERINFFNNSKPTCNSNLFYVSPTKILLRLLILLNNPILEIEMTFFERKYFTQDEINEMIQFKSKQLSELLSSTTAFIESLQ